MHSSALAVHLRIDEPHLSFHHAVVVDRSLPIVDLPVLLQLHLSRNPVPATLLRVGGTWYGQRPDYPVEAPAGITYESDLTVNDVKNADDDVTLVVSELDGWIFDVTFSPFDGKVPELFVHPDFGGGQIPAPGTGTEQLARSRQPNPGPSRATEWQSFKVRARYAPELLDPSTELRVAQIMMERGLSLVDLRRVMRMSYERPSYPVLSTIGHDALTSPLPVGKDGLPPVRYTRGLVVQNPGLTGKEHLLHNPESITSSSQVEDLPDVIDLGEEMGLIVVTPGEHITLTDRGRHIFAEAWGQPRTRAELAVDVAVAIGERAGSPFRTRATSPVDLAEVIDFKDYRGSGG